MAASSGLQKAQKRELQDVLRIRPGHSTVPLPCVLFVKSHRPAQGSRGRGSHNGVNTRRQGL